MPVRSFQSDMNVAAPLPPVKSKQPGVSNSLLYSGSRFVGHQKSKGNQYDVEVILQYVNIEECYLCGYLKIKGLTEEYPTLTTFFDGEIISQKHPFLTRKWEADEDVDRKHWVRNNNVFILKMVTSTHFFPFLFCRASFSRFISMQRTSIRTTLTTRVCKTQITCTCDGKNTF